MTYQPVNSLNTEVRGPQYLIPEMKPRNIFVNDPSKPAILPTILSITDI